MHCHILIHQAQLLNFCRIPLLLSLRTVKKYTDICLICLEEAVNPMVCLLCQKIICCIDCMTRYSNSRFNSEDSKCLRCYRMFKKGVTTWSQDERFFLTKSMTWKHATPIDTVSCEDKHKIKDIFYMNRKFDQGPLVHSLFLDLYEHHREISRI